MMEYGAATPMISLRVESSGHGDSAKTEVIIKPTVNSIEVNGYHTDELHFTLYGEEERNNLIILLKGLISDV